MKFPFVFMSRTVYDQMVKDSADERERTARLTRIIVKMKVAGGSIPRALSAGRLPPRELTEFEIDVQRAIDRNPHANRPGFRGQMATFVERALADGIDQKRILTKLRTWHLVTNADGAEPEVTDDDVIPLVFEDGKRSREASR